MSYYEKDKDTNEPYPGFDRGTKIALAIGSVVLVFMVLGLFGTIIG